MWRYRTGQTSVSVLLSKLPQIVVDIFQSDLCTTPRAALHIVAVRFER